MTKAPAEMMREFVKNQNFASTDEIITAMKEMFKDFTGSYSLAEQTS